MKKFKHKKSGFLMIELMVSAAIIVAAFLAASGVAQKSLQVTRQGLHVAQASFLLEEGAEAVRLIRDEAWTGLSALSTSATYYLSFSGGVWTLSETPEAVGIFSRTVQIANATRDANDDLAQSGTADANTRLITVNVSWPEGGTTQQKSMSFYLSNIFEYVP